MDGVWDYLRWVCCMISVGGLCLGLFMVVLSGGIVRWLCLGSFTVGLFRRFGAKAP